VGLEGIVGFFRTILAAMRRLLRSLLGRTDDDRPAI
jgi:hypothetical protein